MTLATAERARHLAAAIAPFRDLLGRITADDLLALVRTELGHEGSLDGFQPHGGHRARAVAPGTILHVVSGNTPHAGLQSLLRGLLLGSHNLCKLPSGGLVPELAAFRTHLPPHLADAVELSDTLPDAWLERADAVIVFGSDATVAELRRRARPGRTFVAHGHRVSLGVIFDDPGARSTDAAAWAVSLFDQQGCLSPQGFYVREAPSLSAREYAGHLAAAMARHHAIHPRAALPTGDSAALAAWREEWRFRAANDPARYTLWTSPGSTAWSVLYDGADPAFTPSPLNRTVIVKPLPADLCAALAPVRPFLSAVGLWPSTREHADWLTTQAVGASRLCPLDRMQMPPLTWHQDGVSPLASLVRWVDFEADCDAVFS